MNIDMDLPQATPEQLGINADKLQRAFRLLDREKDAGEIPGGVAVVGEMGLSPEPMRWVTRLSLRIRI